jgi:hypothetical protein
MGRPRKTTKQDTKKVEVAPPVGPKSGTKAIPSSAELAPEMELVSPNLVAPKSAITCLTSLGCALRLVDIAENAGMTVADAAEFPELLQKNGVPAMLPSEVIRLAHKLYRDRVDAMLWRCRGV